MKGSVRLQGDIIKKLQKYINQIFKLFSPEPLGRFHQNLSHVSDVAIESLVRSPEKKGVF